MLDLGGRTIAPTTPPLSHAPVLAGSAVPSSLHGACCMNPVPGCGIGDASSSFARYQLSLIWKPSSVSKCKYEALAKISGISILGAVYEKTIAESERKGRPHSYWNIYHPQLTYISRNSSCLIASRKTLNNVLYRDNKIYYI
jgi:hypothetical protein